MEQIKHINERNTKSVPPAKINMFEIMQMKQDIAEDNTTTMATEAYLGHVEDYIRVYTWDEVEKHNEENDCWVIYDNRVYDISTFIYDHPAGPAYLLDLAGCDITNEYDEVGHSKFASTQLWKYYIGEVDKNDHREKIDIAQKSSKVWNR